MSHLPDHLSEEQIRDFITGALEGADEERVREHLTECEVCSALATEEAALDHALWEARQLDHEADAAIGALDETGEVAAVAALPDTPAASGVISLASERRKRMTLWLSSGAAVVAAAAALLVMVQLGDAEPEATIAAAPAAPASTTPGTLAAPGAAAAATPPPEQPAGPTAAAAAAPAEEPASDPAAVDTPKAPEPSKAASSLNRVPRTTATPKPKPKPRSRPAASKPPPPPPPTRSKRDCDPVLDFDCGEAGARSAGSRSSTLGPSDVLSVVRKSLPKINACGEKHGVSATVKMEWRILKSGNTTSVKVLSPKYVGTPVGRCLVREVKRMRFPAYSGKPPPPVKFPFKLKG
jgi:hypothetical protein